MPAFLIHGDEDKVVPLEENSAEFAARYRAAGAGEAVTLIVAEGPGAQLLGGVLPLPGAGRFRHRPRTSGAAKPAQIITRLIHTNPGTR